MIRLKSVVFGGLVFVVTHLVVVSEWSWMEPGRADPPWFLNAGRAVAFTAVCLFMAGALRSGWASVDIRGSILEGANVAAGAALAMCAVLVAKGPGTLFPIALAIGAAIAAASSIAGALVGWAGAAALRTNAR